MRFYIREEPGATFYVETLEEALRHLSGPKGYRLTISEEEAGSGTEIVIRTGDFVISKDLPGQLECYDANVVIRLK